MFVTCGTGVQRAEFWSAHSLQRSTAVRRVTYERRGLDRPIKRLRQLQSRLEVVVREGQALRIEVLRATDLGPLRDFVLRKRRRLT